MKIRAYWRAGARGEPDPARRLRQFDAGGRSLDCRHADDHDRDAVGHVFLLPHLGLQDLHGGASGEHRLRADGAVRERHAVDHSDESRHREPSRHVVRAADRRIDHGPAGTPGPLGIAELAGGRLRRAPTACRSPTSATCRRERERSSTPSRSRTRRLAWLLELREERLQHLRVALVRVGERLHVVFFRQLLLLPVRVERDLLAAAARTCRTADRRCAPRAGRRRRRPARTPSCWRRPRRSDRGRRRDTACSRGAR